jgi:uncharacterized protein YcgI (DUF1989 family)
MDTAVLPPPLPPGERVIVPARSARAFLVPAGAVVRVIDVEGQQVADVVAACAERPAETLSGIVSTQLNKAVYPTTGDVLYSVQRRPMFTIVADTVGRHDFLMGACSPTSYRLRYGVEDHPNCQVLLGTALAPFGVPPDVPDTFNAFMNVPIGPDGKLTVEVPRSHAGDYVDLRAEMDLILGVAACPADLSACNNWNPTAIGLELVG